MAALNFPILPVHGQKYPSPAIPGQPQFQYDNNEKAWVRVTPALSTGSGGNIVVNGATVIVSEPEPTERPDATPLEVGDLWWKISTEVMRVYTDNTWNDLRVTIPNLDASKITTGELDAARIPNLDTSKVTTGTFETARIPNLDASKITTGELGVARIPDLDASKITTGNLNVDVLPSSAHTWQRLGSGITTVRASAEYNGGNQKSNPQISADGTLVAIAFDGHGASDNQYASVINFYQKSNNIWSVVNEIVLPFTSSTDKEHARSLALSGDGTTLAVIIDPWTTGDNLLRVYRDISGTWTQIGSDIINNDLLDAVSISYDGSTVIVGAPQSTGSPGYARVYEDISGTWTQVGSDLVGDTNGDNFGWAVDISNDGLVIAVSSPQHSTVGRGYTRVFNNQEGTWTQIGSDIQGDSIGDMLGKSLALSGDGTTIIVGTTGWGQGDSPDLRLNVGYVRVYENVSDVWTELGGNLYGPDPVSDFGEKVSISDDGSIIAIGVPGTSEMGQDSGTIKTHRWNGTSWDDLREIHGYTDSAFGTYVQLTADGLKLIGGTEIKIAGYANRTNIYEFKSMFA